MKEHPIQIGDVLVVTLPQHFPLGHEQEGIRPAIVVGLPHRLGKPRYPMLLIVPLTTQSERWTKKEWGLYPTLEAETGGLTKPSVVLLDHLRAIDQNRIKQYIGNINLEDFAEIQERVLLMFKLPPPYGDYLVKSEG